MKQTTIKHFGLAKWIRWSEQQAKAAGAKLPGQVLIYTFDGIQCVWFT